MPKDKISKEVVRERLKYPYEIKVRMTERRLSEFITYYGEDGVVVSISGGLDSTAAMHFIHKRYPRVTVLTGKAKAHRFHFGQGRIFYATYTRTT